MSSTGDNLMTYYRHCGIDEDNLHAHKKAAALAMKKYKFQYSNVCEKIIIGDEC
jgi:hypothetical protein